MLGRHTHTHTYMHNKSVELNMNRSKMIAFQYTLCNWLILHCWFRKVVQLATKVSTNKLKISPSNYRWRYICFHLCSPGTVWRSREGSRYIEKTWEHFLLCFSWGNKLSFHFERAWHKNREYYALLSDKWKIENAKYWQWDIRLCLDSSVAAHPDNPPWPLKNLGIYFLVFYSFSFLFFFSMFLKTWFVFLK